MIARTCTHCATTFHTTDPRRIYCKDACQRAASVAKTVRTKRMQALRHAAALCAVAGAGLVQHSPNISAAAAEWEWRSAGGTHCPVGESERN